MIPEVNVAVSASYGPIEVALRTDLADAESPNDQLRELVAASALPQAVAMTVFNGGLGAAGCTETQWKGFLTDPASPRFVPLPEAWLTHAVEQFARIGIERAFA